MAKTLTKKRKIGDLGEDIAQRFLMKQGFRVIHKNYLKKWGEIDLVMKKVGKYHFVEVKTVSCEIIANKVIHETLSHRPEENMHENKLKRLGRAIQTYLLENDIEGKWQLDGVFVYLDKTSKQARVEVLENIVINT